MIILTFTEKFDYLKTKYAAKADFSKIDKDIAAQFTLTDSDCGGIFYIAHIDGKTSIEPYDYHDNTVAVRTSSVTLERILSGKTDPVKAFLDGKLDVEGEPEHAEALIAAIRTAKKKPSRPES